MSKVKLLLAILSLCYHSGQPMSLEGGSDIDEVLKLAEEEIEKEFQARMLEGFQDVRKLTQKITRESQLMEEFNALFKKTSAMLTISRGLSSEDEAITFAQLAFETRINRGMAAGQGVLVDEPEQIDIGCFGAQPIQCNEDTEFRSITGVCNNLENPMWGSMSIAFRRFVGAQYADGQEVPRGGFMSAMGHCNTGNSNMTDECMCHSDAKALLPNPRELSIQLHPDEDRPDPTITHMVMQFGQFLDHDITLTPESEDLDCCEVPDPDKCFNIGIPCDDSHFLNLRAPPGFTPHSPYGGGGRCRGSLEFIRSVPFCHTKIQHREQMNGITAFVDASNVYGSSVKKAMELRSFEEGKLKVDKHNLLPVINGERMAGDVRSLENPGLAGLHTIWVREHNRIAEEIHCANSSLSDEEIYQCARRIVGAEMQNIVYGQFLPVVLGNTVMQEHNLVPNFYSQYNPKVDPSIRNSFATAAYRFGHSLIRGLIQMVNVMTLQVAEQYNFREAFFNTSRYESDCGRGMEQILLGRLIQQAQSRDQFVTRDVTDFLFANNAFPGSDLIARNIQRGRDHGIAAYNDYREFCGLPRVCSWEERPEEFTPTGWAELESQYNDPRDIDLFVAGLFELPLPGSLVGPTFSCLLAKQFELLKFGDRFFFTHKGPNVHHFSEEQLENIRSRGLGDVICDNTELMNANSDVFRNVQGPAPINIPVISRSCQMKNKLDISLFVHEEGVQEQEEKLPIDVE